MCGTNNFFSRKSKNLLLGDNPGELKLQFVMHKLKFHKTVIKSPQKIATEVHSLELQAGRDIFGIKQCSKLVIFIEVSSFRD